MFGRRRRRERDEFRSMHAKIAAIHGDVIRRDGALLDALEDLAAVTREVGCRLEEQARFSEVMARLVAASEPLAIDLGEEPRVVGGSVAPARLGAGTRAE
jgi:hypothetical protein